MFWNGSDQDWYSHSNSLIQIKFTIVLHLMNINQTRKALVWLYIKFLPLPFYISKRQKLLRWRTNFCPTIESLSLFYFVTSPPQHIICWKTHFPEYSLLQKWDKKLWCLRRFSSCRHSYCLKVSGQETIFPTEAKYETLKKVDLSCL